jgi:hypothetical protein
MRGIDIIDCTFLFADHLYVGQVEGCEFGWMIRSYAP